MHTAVARRQRHRLAARRRPGGGREIVASLVLAVPLVLVTLVALLVTGGVVIGAAAYSYYASDLPDPRNTLESLTFSRQTAVYDRTGKVLLARLGTDRRELVAFDDIPGELVDATIAIEDKTFWDNAGFDPAGFVSAVIDTLNGRERGGSTITQQLVRNRLLPASASAEGDYVRKVKEIIQSLRLTAAYPGEAGKRAIMEVYLNNNNYGNRTYGPVAAARGYWDKDLDDLTLAQYAILAAIPKSPTTFNLFRSVVEEAGTDEHGEERMQLVVPQDSRIVRRRNQVLDLMEARQRLTLGEYTEADFQAAKVEPVILSAPADERWLALQFVWQVRDELEELICGKPDCPEIDLGGYRVTTTLDYGMQRIVEKWVYAAAIIPNAKKPDAALRSLAIPRREWSWIKSLRGHNIHNAASAVLDYRTGEVLAYAGSASARAKGSRKLQPQFDVLADGWRQPGSSIKPLVYLIGIDDRRMTAATLFMDVVTNFTPGSAKAYAPTQADRLERGPVRLRSALQFSLNIPAIKAGFINGLRHQFKRVEEFGLSHPKGVVAVASQSIGTIETHPIELISAYGMIANGGVLMQRHTILTVVNASGEQIWPAAGQATKGKRLVSRQAAYIVTDILAGNSQERINPFWGRWAVTNGVGGAKTRPAAYKTGTTNDNRDVHAYGYLAAPSDNGLPALVAGVWMGNSDNSPNDGKLSLDTSAPLWSAILSDVSRGMPIEGFARTRPKGLVTATVDAFTGMKRGPSTQRTVTELFIAGTVPQQSLRARTVVVDGASGLLWRAGCAGPKVARSFIDYSRVEAGFAAWQKADAAWQRRAARGPGMTGGPRGTRTAYFYGGGFYPYGRSWGGRFAPSTPCPIASAPTPACNPDDPLATCPPTPPPAPSGDAANP